MNPQIREEYVLASLASLETWDEISKFYFITCGIIFNRLACEEFSHVVHSWT